MTSLQQFAGMRVVISPHLLPTRRYTFDPRHEVPMSDEFRAEMEAWALDFFSPHDVALVTSDTVFLSPKHAALLRL